MTETYIISLGRETLYAIILVAAPVLGVSLLMGLLVSFFQATTQMQDQTLSFVPKIIAVFVAIAIFAPWMLKILVFFAENLYQSIQYLAR